MSVFITGAGIVPKLYDPVFADNTWEQIIKACQSGEVPETWVVGDQKTMTINGTDYPIDIIGINHDTYSDGTGTAPLTFQMHDCYGIRYGVHTSDVNTNGWNNCAMRITHLPAILALMPTEVQNGIRKVNKKTSVGGQKANEVIIAEDNLFLLSEIEVFGTANKSLSGEGTQYAYYVAGNSKAKTVNGSSAHWWTRSPEKDVYGSYCRVNSTSSIGTGSPTTELGVAFAFCF